MSTYLMFGTYSMEAVKFISAKRTEETRALIKQNGGELVTIAPHPYFGESGGRCLALDRVGPFVLVTTGADEVRGARADLRLHGAVDQALHWPP